MSPSSPNISAAEQLAGAWNLDPDHTNISIRHRTMWGLTSVRGTFTRVHGHGKMGVGGEIAGTVTVEAASINTRNKRRDKHLRSGSFLDATNHPEIVITIRGTLDATGEARLDATIDVRGKRQALSAKVDRLQTNNDYITATVTTQIDRRDIGLGSGPLGMMRDITTVHVEASFTRSPPEPDPSMP